MLLKIVKWISVREIRINTKILGHVKSSTYNCNGVGSHHFRRCENGEIRNIGQNVQKCDDGQGQVDGSGQIDERIFEFFSHKIQVVPAGV